MSDEYKKATDDATATLQMLEDAVAKSAGRFDGLRDRADKLFDERVAQLAKQHNVDTATAQGLAASDEIAGRAYALSQELADHQEHAHEAGGQIAAYVG